MVHSVVTGLWIVSLSDAKVFSSPKDRMMNEHVGQTMADAVRSAVRFDPELFSLYVDGSSARSE